MIEGDRNLTAVRCRSGQAARSRKAVYGLEDIIRSFDLLSSASPGRTSWYLLGPDMHYFMWNGTGSTWSPHLVARQQIPQFVRSRFNADPGDVLGEEEAKKWAAAGKTNVGQGHRSGRMHW